MTSQDRQPADQLRTNWVLLPITSRDFIVSCFKVVLLRLFIAAFFLYPFKRKFNATVFRTPQKHLFDRDTKLVQLNKKQTHGRETIALISSFHRDVNGIFALLVRYTA
jgi:hypothetical protein